jgi:pimeloyl-ACP methyl ester carboxylesterase
MPNATSTDGTTIAYSTIGQGPAVILVDGATGFRWTSAPSELAQLLASEFTVYSYDRRGRGESSDTSPYAVEREVEDIEALIDAAGGAAALYGISSGGALALEATLGLPSKVTKLAIYEVPYDDSAGAAQAWHAYRTQLANFLAAGQRGEAAALFMRFVGVPDEMLAGMRESPMWPIMEAVAPTLTYDAAALGPDRCVPVARAKAVSVPTLIMDGSASEEMMPFMRRTAETLTAAIPQARHEILPGQRHDVDAKVLAPVLAAFLNRRF